MPPIIALRLQGVPFERRAVHSIVQPFYGSNLPETRTRSPQSEAEAYSSTEADGIHPFSVLAKPSPLFSVLSIFTTKFNQLVDR
jgi:hypothetical protein